jgi:hypothetical protein
VQVHQTRKEPAAPKAGLMEILGFPVGLFKAMGWPDPAACELFCKGFVNLTLRMTSASGYSGKALAQKLGFTPWTRVKTRNAPGNYQQLLGDIPSDVTISTRLRRPVDFVHVFVVARAQLVAELRRALEEIEEDGAIWVSWPKKSSGVRTDITEDVIREVALPMGLVDVKVCAVDETWSGLKLVIRKANRKS